MKKKEILELFNTELNPTFESWGFKYFKSKQTAVKQEDHIVKKIFFDANYFLGKASFQPYLRIRNEEYMNLRKEINPKYDNNHFITIGLHLPEVASYYNREDLNFLRDDLGDFDGGSYVYNKTMPFFKSKFIEFMEEIGIRFFEMFYTNKDFDNWFNRGLLQGKYKNMKFNQDRVPMYSFMSAYIAKNENAEDIYNYWINSEIYEEAKGELKLMRRHLKTKL